MWLRGLPPGKWELPTIPTEERAWIYRPLEQYSAGAGAAAALATDAAGAEEEKHDVSDLGIPGSAAANPPSEDGRGEEESKGDEHWWTDGSGGELGSDPRLRRCGWAAARYDGEVIRYAVFGTLEGAQTVPKAELRALTEAAEKSAMTKRCIVYSDCSYVVKGFQARCKTRRWAGGPHAGLWQRIGLHAHRLIVNKVKAHMKHEDVAEDAVAQMGYRGNLIADMLAGEAAARAALPGAMCESVHEGDKVVRRVQKRLIRVLELAALSSTPNEEVRRGARVPRTSAVQQALQGSEHDWVKLRFVWRCALCRRFAGPRAIVRVAATACAVHRRRAAEATGEALAGVAGEVVEPQAGPEGTARGEQVGSEGGGGGAEGVVPIGAAPLLPRGRAQDIGSPEPTLDRPTPLAPGEADQLGIHAGHRVERLGDAIFCWRCGFYAVRQVRALKDPCAGVPNRRGAENLRAVARGSKLGAKPPR